MNFKISLLISSLLFLVSKSPGVSTMKTLRPSTVALWDWHSGVTAAAAALASKILSPRIEFAVELLPSPVRPTRTILYSAGGTKV